MGVMTERCYRVQILYSDFGVLFVFSLRISSRTSAFRRHDQHSVPNREGRKMDCITGRLTPVESRNLLKSSFIKSKVYNKANSELTTGSC